MADPRRNDARPMPEDADLTYRARRDAIERANAGYLASHGLLPSDGRRAPADAPPTAEHGTDRIRRPR